VDAVTSLVVAATGVFTLGDPQKRLFFEETLDSIVAQWRRLRLRDDVLVSVVYLRSAELRAFRLRSQQRKRAEDVFHVGGLSSHESLEAVDLRFSEGSVDVRFGDGRTAFLFSEATGLIKHVNGLSGVTVLAGGERRGLRDNALLENSLGEGVSAVIEDRPELGGVIGIEDEFVVL